MQVIKALETSTSQYVSPENQSTRRFGWVIAGMAVAATLMILLGTAKWGIGISPDGTIYIGAARSLLSSGSLQAVDPLGQTSPLVHYPPMVPVLLAGISSVFRVDPISAARWLSAVSFGLNVGLLSLIAWRVSKSPWMAILAGTLGLIATPMVDIHLLALSEPPYLVFVLLSFLCLTRYSEHRTLPWLLLAASASAFAFLTRYASASLIAAELLWLLAFGRAQLVTRVRACVVFALVSCFPIAGWFLRNYFVSGAPTTAHPATHIATLPTLLLGLNSVSTWLLPGAVPPSMRAGFLAALSLALIYLYTKGKTGHSLDRHEDVDRGIVGLCALFIGCHLALLIGTNSFLYGDVPLDDRNLLPIYGPVVLILLTILHRVGSFRLMGQPAWLLPAAVVALLFAVNTPRTASHLANAARQGRDYSSRQWQTSPIIGKLKTLPAGIPVYTTLPSSVHFLTGHAARLLPYAFDVRNQAVNEEFDRNMLEMRNESLDKGIVVIFFSENTSSAFVRESDVKESLHLVLVAKDSLGSMYQSVPASQSQVFHANEAVQLR